MYQLTLNAFQALPLMFVEPVLLLLNIMMQTVALVINQVILELRLQVIKLKVVIPIISGRTQAVQIHLGQVQYQHLLVLKAIQQIMQLFTIMAIKVVVQLM